MAHIEKRRQAITLRMEGKSYSQIKSELKVSKSTLSIWLRELPLSADRMKELRDNSQIRIEKYRNTMKQKHSKRLTEYYDEQKEKWIPLSNRELFIAGLFLYWGEGNKANKGIVSLNNTDPMLVKFGLYWFLKSLKVPRNKVQVFLHLYDDMDIEKELKFWREELNMPMKNFSKPYIKKSIRSNLDQKGFGHGTCGVRVFDTKIKERIIMGLKAISDAYT